MHKYETQAIVQRIDKNNEKYLITNFLNVDHLLNTLIYFNILDMLFSIKYLIKVNVTGFFLLFNILLENFKYSYFFWAALIQNNNTINSGINI